MIMENTSLAPLIIVVSTGLQILTVTLVAARISTRFRQKQALYSHDWFILVAEILSIPEYIFILIATTYNYGRHQRFVPPDDISTAMRYVFMTQFVWAWNIILVKCSVALLLLSLKHDRRWRLFLYLTMALLVAALIMITLTQFLSCTPLPAYWDARARLKARCWPLESISGFVVAFSSINALADIVYSLMPLAFLIRLNQPLYQKCVIATLMSLGLLSSVAAVFRTIDGLEIGDDQFRADAVTSLLALVELHVGITAATLPTLKAFFERLVGNIRKLLAEGPLEGETVAILFQMGWLDDMHGTTRSDVEKKKMDFEIEAR